MAFGTGTRRQGSLQASAALRVSLSLRLSLDTARRGRWWAVVDGSRGRRPELGEVDGRRSRCLIRFGLEEPAMSDDRLTELHDRITAAVEALVTGEDWQQMLSVAARFHTYSAHERLADPVGESTCHE